MKFKVEHNNQNSVVLMRRLGYHTHGNRTMSFARRLTHDEFPRFHVYLDDLGDSWEVSLHLDQKRASYGEQTAHSGDYDGQLLEEEKQRIITQLNN